LRPLSSITIFEWWNLPAASLRDSENNAGTA
jgi:hypothetical protein